MGPSSTNGATIARLRRPATKVIVFQWPCGTWKTTRIFRRYPERHYEIIEGECQQEDLVPAKDAHGNDIFVSHPQRPDGSVSTVK